MLTVRDHMALTLATTPYRYPGARAADMLELCGYSETRFWARVNHLLDQPAAEVERPAEVRRLRRLRERRQRARTVANG